MNYLYPPAKGQFNTIDSPVRKPSRFNNKSSHDYENYEQQLDTYERVNKSYLNEWDSLSSPSIKPQNSTILPQAKQSSTLAEDKTTKTKTENDDNTIVNNKQAYYVKRYAPDEPEVNYDRLSMQHLQAELKSMRMTMQELNQQLNRMLNKYEMANVTEHISEQTIRNSPQKEMQIISKEIETNRRLLQAQQKQLKKVMALQKEYEERDYLIELEQRASQLMRQIWGKRKEKKHAEVQVQKLDNVLLDLKDDRFTDEFKNIKVLKHQILYHFKKFHQNKARLDQIDHNIEDVNMKDEQVTKKLSKYASIVESNSMEVKANQPFIALKKKYTKFQTEKQTLRRQIEVANRSHKVNTEKLEKECQDMEEEMKVIERKMHSLDEMVHHLVEQTERLIKTNKLEAKLIDKVSYKFGEDNLKSERYSKKPNFIIRSGRVPNTTGEQSSNHSQDLSLLQEGKQKPREENKLPRIHNRNLSYDSKKLQLNDKNTIEVPEQKIVTPIKPLLKVFKGAVKSKDAASFSTPMTHIKESPIYKPPRLNRLARKKEERTIA